MTKHRGRGTGSAWYIPGRGFLSDEEARRLLRKARQYPNIAALVKMRALGRLTPDQEAALDDMLADLAVELLGAVDGMPGAE
jgi:hypothetical protein